MTNDLIKTLEKQRERRARPYKAHDYPYSAKKYLDNGARLVPFIRAVLDELGMTEIEVLPNSLDCLVDGWELKIRKQEEFDEACRQHGYSDEIGEIDGFVSRDDASFYVLDHLFEKGIQITGHEIGHILGGDLENEIDREATAIAFEYAWCCAAEKVDLVEPPFSPLELFLKERYRKYGNPTHYFTHYLVRCMASSAEEALELFNKFSNGYDLPSSNIYLFAMFKVLQQIQTYMPDFLIKSLDQL